MSLCVSCGACLQPHDVCWGQKLICRASMSGPEEYEDVPLCFDCYHHGDEREDALRDAAAEKRWEERTGR